MHGSIEILDIKSQENMPLGSLGFLYTHGMNIGKWVKSSRESAGLTQEQLAEKIGKTKANISAWENNKHSPSFEQILLIGEISNFSIPLAGIEKLGIRTSGGHAAPWPFAFGRERFDRLPPDRQQRIGDFALGVITEWEATHRRKEQA